MTAPMLFGEQERFQLSQLYQMVNTNQKEMMEVVRGISEAQKDTAYSQKEIAKILEHVLEKLERR